MITLKKALEAINFNVTALSNLLADEKSSENETQKSIKRRYFIRIFATLGEILVYFRNKKELNQQGLESLFVQLENTKLLGEMKDTENKNLVTGFTSRRNKLLHQYPFEFHQGNYHIYDDSVAYFKNNFKILKQTVDTLLNQIKDVKNKESLSLTKINFDPPVYNKTSSFSEDYLLPLVLAVQEVHELLALLKYFNFIIEPLIHDENRKTEDMFNKMFFEEKISQFTNDLNVLLNEKPYFKEAFANLLENISVFLGKTNKSYNELSSKEKSIEQKVLPILEKLDDLYNNLQEKEEDAILYLGHIANRRTKTAHDYEEAFDINQLVPDLISLAILQEQYLKPSISIILNHGYAHPLASQKIVNKLPKEEVEEIEVPTFKKRKIEAAFFHSQNPEKPENETKKTEEEETSDKPAIQEAML